MGKKAGKIGAFPSNFVKEIFVCPKGLVIVLTLYAVCQNLSYISILTNTEIESVSP